MAAERKRERLPQKGCSKRVFLISGSWMDAHDAGLLFAFSIDDDRVIARRHQGPSVILAVPIDKVPLGLVKKIVQFRVKQNEEKAGLKNTAKAIVKKQPVRTAR